MIADRPDKPLSRARWFRGLHHMAQACEQAAAGDQAGLIREMHELMARAPGQALLSGLALPDAALLEMRLGARCCDSAALAMLGADTGYLVSRGERGCHLASVLLPGDSEEATAAGHTLALALIGALALALCGGAATACPEPPPKLDRHLH